MREGEQVLDHLISVLMGPICALCPKIEGFTQGSNISSFAEAHAGCTVENESEFSFLERLHCNPLLCKSSLPLMATFLCRMRRERTAWWQEGAGSSSN